MNKYSVKALEDAKMVDFLYNHYQLFYGDTFKVTSKEEIKALVEYVCWRETLSIAQGTTVVVPPVVPDHLKAINDKVMLAEEVDTEIMNTMLKFVQRALFKYTFALL